MTDEATYRRNRNRLSSVRWPLGHEPYPDVPGTHEDDPWVNIRLEVKEGGEEPRQRHLLRSGQETPFRCHKCGERLRIAAEISVQEQLAPLNYRPPPGTIAPKEPVVVLACPNETAEEPHPTQQMRSSLLTPALRRMR